MKLDLCPEVSRMDREGKPIPVPRRLNNQSPLMVKEDMSLSSMQRNGNANNLSTGINSNGNNTNAFTSNPKPIPLPRKLLQRLSSSSSSSDKRKSPNSKFTILQQSGIGIDLTETVPDDVKRGTINIFKRGRSIDPFDTEFESSLKDAELLTAITFPSPLDDISPESRSRFSTVSSSSALADDYNYYTKLNKSGIANDVMSMADTELKVPSAPAINANSKTNSSYANKCLDNPENLQKSSTPSPLTIHSSNNHDRENESSETDGSESIYEPISSYSSSDSGSVSSELPPNLGRKDSGSVTIEDKSYSPGPRSGGKFASFEACDFIADQPRNSRDSFKKLDFQSRVVGGGENRYERLRDESLSSSMPAIDDDDVKTQCATNSVLSSGGPAPSTSPANFLRRNPSSRSSDSAASSVSYSSSVGEKKRTAHEYDDVTIEDGNVVFLDNQLNSTATVENYNNSNSSIASIVMEFDPLFDSNSKSSSSDSSNTKYRNPQAEEEIYDPDHRYEYIDGESNTARCSTLDAFPTDFTNPEYFPVAPVPVKREESLSTVAEEIVRGNIATPNGSGNGSTESSASSEQEEEYEPIAPVRPPMDKDVVPRLKTKGKPLTILDDSLTRISINSEDGKSEQSLSVGTTQANFFRRLSNKIRLIPIREETSSPKESTATNLSGSQSPPCGKCFEEHLEGTRCKFTPFARPSIVFASNLYRQSTGLRQKEFSKKWVILSKGKLTFSNEKSVVLDEICLTKVAVISKKNEPVVIQNMQELKCFQLNFIGGKSTSMTLAAITEGERCSWMQKYMEVFAPAFPLAVISSYDRGGWCYMKESLTGNWSPSWIIIKDRTLFYSFSSCGEVYEVDLRKIRSIKASNSKDGDHNCPFVDNYDVLTVDMIYRILYVQTDSPKITSSWEKVIEAAAKKNGTEFHQMQLTMDNVPVIVDKCIDFLYAHGTLAEGIYRQSGSNTRITQLLAEFQKDAWTVQISPKEFSAHDVAGTLKRFFRTLPEPLVSAKLYQEWIDTSGMKDHNKKMEEYLNLLSQLSEISYNIMKKLICHLYAVHELHEKNLMPLINLAPIWGPTLMNVDNSKLSESASAQSYKVACAECEVVKDLIENYYTLFRVDSQERDKEKKMQDALENFHLGSTKRKCSGDMKMWIYIGEKDETSAINITLTPLSTSNTIIQQLCSMAKLKSNDNLSLHEVICQQFLERPLHASERVIETVLRWSIWDIDERKDNYLILKKNTLYPALIPHAKDPSAVYGELKYADSKSKTFRKYNFSFSGAMLKYSKDSKASIELPIEDIVWYLGSEPKRTPPTRWTFTFVKRNYPFKRSRDEPYFGNVVSCNTEEELHRWIGAMVVGEHRAGLYPSVIV